MKKEKRETGLRSVVGSFLPDAVRFAFYFSGGRVRGQKGRCASLAKEFKTTSRKTRGKSTVTQSAAFPFVCSWLVNSLGENMAILVPFPPHTSPLLLLVFPSLSSEQGKNLHKSQC